MSRYTSNEFTVYKSVRMREDLARKLERYAARRNVSEGEVIRQALEMLLDPSKAERRQGKDEEYEG